MKKFRALMIVLALAVMVGEVVRSWGDGRNIIWVLDDILAGLYMLAAAIAFKADTPALRAFFASAFGIAVGMLYMSFFSSFLEPASTNSGNFNLNFLITVKGILFVASILGLAASILMPYAKDTPHE